MSEISALSHQYESLRSATDNLNGAIVLFKKKRLMGRKVQSQKYPQLTVSTSELQEAREYLIAFLKSVQAAFLEENVATEFIPDTLLEEYKKRLKSADPYLASRLENVIGSLEKEEPLQDAHFRLLDNVLSALDVERTVVFKKLRTGRHG